MVVAQLILEQSQQLIVQASKLVMELVLRVLPECSIEFGSITSLVTLGSDWQR